MQIINDPSRSGSLASAFGSGINQLADLKLAQLTQKYDQELERTQFKKTWGPLLEPVLGKSTVNILSNFTPDERKNALGDIDSLIQLNEAPSSREEVSGMQSLANAPQQNPQQDFMQAIQNRFTNQSVGQRPQEEQGSLLSGLAGASQQYQQQPQEQVQQGQQLNPERAKLIENLFKTPQQKAAEQKLEIEKRKEARAEEAAKVKEREIDAKETKVYIDSLKDREKAAKETDLRLKRMEKLIDKGNLPNATLWSALTKIEDLGPIATGGIGALLGSVGGVLGSVVPGVGTAFGAGIGAGVGGAIGSLGGTLAGAIKSNIKTGTPDIEEFEKLSNEFVKGAKQYFGSRITEKEVQMYMQTVPTLLQTDAGKRKIIENIRALNELVEIEAKAARSIIRANGGIRPRDLEQQVQDKISNKIDEVAKRFIG